MFGARKVPPAGCNFVHNDEIWKDHILHELHTSRKWPETWGFLKDINKPTGVEQEVGSHSSKSQLNLMQALDLASHSRKYPQSTATEIGQRHEFIRYLERFGHHAKGRTTVFKLLNWPQEAV